MGKIPYSICGRTVNIAERTLAKKNGTLDSFEPVQKFFANAQQREYIDLSKFAEHIADHHSKYSKGDIYCVLSEAVTCMRELMLQGNKIGLGDMGDFYLTLKSTGADYYDEFSANNITAVNARWTVGKNFRNMISDATFELVESRKAAAATLAQIRASYPTRPVDEEQDNGSDNTGGSGNSGNTGGSGNSGNSGGNEQGGSGNTGGDDGGNLGE